MPRRGERSPKLIPGDRTDPLGFAVLVEEFLEDQLVHGYSPKTVENRRYNLTYLVLWLADRGVTRPSEVTKPMLDRYQRAVFHHRKPDGQPLSFRSQVQRLTPVRALFKWLARQNRILYNPASELELPKAERRLPKAVLSQAEAEQILAVPDLHDPLGLRDRAMLELFYATGLRRSELAGLRVFDLDVERLTLAVRQGKGRKDRMIPTGERAAAWIARYLADVRPRLAVEPDDGVLFLTVDGTMFSPDRLTGLVADYVKRSGVGKPGACHLFRHTMATLMLEGGADIRFIQQMLGHADISTTQIYTQVSLRQLRAIHTATHPGAQNVSRRHPTAESPEQPSREPSSLPRRPNHTAGIPGKHRSRTPAATRPAAVPSGLRVNLIERAARDPQPRAKRSPTARQPRRSRPVPFFVAAVFSVPRHRWRSGSRTAKRLTHLHPGAYLMFARAVVADETRPRAPQDDGQRYA
jgi:integrase/recombinase XerD